MIHTVMSMEKAAAYASAMDIRLIPYELAENMEKTKTIINGLIPEQDIAVFIGPEGGFEASEITRFFSYRYRTFPV